MRDTVWSILLTQIPIAVACILVAWELRGIRKALAQLADVAKSLRQKNEGPRDG